MELKDYINFIRRRWLLLFAVPFFSILVAYVASNQLTPTYRASSTVLIVNVAPPVQPTTGPGPAATPEPTATPVTPAGPLGSTPVPQVNDILINERLANTYLQLVNRRPVLERVVDGLSLNISPQVLAAKISVSNQLNTQLIRITAEDASPEIAAAIANETAKAFIAEIDEEIQRKGTVRIAETAVPPHEPASPNIRLNMMIAGMLGILLAVALGVTLNYADTTFATPEAIETASGLATLGVISRARVPGQVQPLLSGSPNSQWAEDYRRLRTQLLSEKRGPAPRTLLITSERAGEGKTFTAANLAVALALGGDKVILVDADLRSPSLHQFFKLTNQDGLANVLYSSNGTGPEAIPVVQTDIPNLLLLASGEATAANPSDSLISDKMLELIAKLRAEADFVIFDSPPMADGADASIMAARTDATLLVVEYHRTRAQDLALAVQRLRQSGAGTLGVVLNKWRDSGALT
jgi:succinoglycan biosynthesis transport protein ExoP